MTKGMTKDTGLKLLLVILPVVVTVIFWASVDPAMKILLGMLDVAIAVAALRGGWPLIKTGLQQTGRTMRAMWFRVLLGMALGGFIQVLVPSAMIADWLGPASGLKGIFIGSYAGLFFSGGPYVILPVVAAIYKAGAGAGPVISVERERRQLRRPAVRMRISPGREAPPGAARLLAGLSCATGYRWKGLLPEAPAALR